MALQSPKSETPIDWSSGLCDCFEDAATCCYGFWCCPCMAGTVSTRFGESCILPLCDCCPSAMTAIFGIPCFCPPAGIGLRTAVRNRYNIKGSVCKDILIAWTCTWCNWCQMQRELRHWQKLPTIINVHQTVNQQPPVMMAPQQPINVVVNSY